MLATTSCWWRKMDEFPYVWLLTHDSKATDFTRHAIHDASLVYEHALSSSTMCGSLRWPIPWLSRVPGTASAAGRDRFQPSRFSGGPAWVSQNVPPGAVLGRRAFQGQAAHAQP